MKSATFVIVWSNTNSSLKYRHLAAADVMRTKRGSVRRLDADVWKAEVGSGKMGPVCASLNTIVVTVAPVVILRTATAVPLGDINEMAEPDVFTRLMQQESSRLT